MRALRRNLGRSIAKVGFVSFMTWAAPAAAQSSGDWPLFDPAESTRRSGFGVGYADLREAGELEARRGLALEYWGSVRTTRGVGFADLRQVLRASGFERSTFAFGVAEALHAGLALGPLLVATGAGLTPIGVDVSDGDVSLAVLSPESSLLLALELGSVRLAARGHVQFLFRLLGRDNAVVRGVTLELGFLKTR